MLMYCHVVVYRHLKAGHLSVLFILCWFVLCFTGIVCWVWVSFLSSLSLRLPNYAVCYIYTCFHGYEVVVYISLAVT